jgi:signal transduction histidine kinase
MPTLTRSTTETADLLSLAVHEFRTPVTVVAGYLRMLAKEQAGPMGERQLALVREAEKSCARLTALVAELSDLANLEGATAPLGREDVVLDPIVDEVIASVTEGRDRGIAVARDQAAPTPAVAGDRKRLRDIVQALLVSVLREQSAPLTVMVHTGTRVIDGVSMVVMGIGAGDASRKVLDQADSPDIRLNELRGGLGMALPIARRVVEQLGGRVWSSAIERAIGSVALILPVRERTT